VIDCNLDECLAVQFRELLGAAEAPTLACGKYCCRYVVAPDVGTYDER